MTINTYPRETVEFQPISVTVDSVPVLTGVEVCVVVDGTRPVTWVAPTTLSGKLYVLITGLGVGNWRVWARITASPEAAVIDCGYFTIT